MNILALDTSAKAASCAVYKNGILLAESFLNVDLKHSQTLMPMVKSMLDCARLDLSAVDVFAVSVGPGSFTGLRIGISAAKGMAMPHNKPCFAVSTLEALAYNLEAFDGIVVPVMDARRNQAYMAVFKNDCGILTRQADDEALGMDEAYEKLKNFTGPVMLTGDGAGLFYHTLSMKLPNLKLAPQNFLHQKASSVCAAAWNRLSNGDAEGSAEALAPVYLRLPQAERERLERLEKN